MVEFHRYGRMIVTHLEEFDSPLYPTIYGGSGEIGRRLALWKREIAGSSPVCRPNNLMAHWKLNSFLRIVYVDTKMINIQFLKVQYFPQQFIWALRSLAYLATFGK